MTKEEIAVAFESFSREIPKGLTGNDEISMLATRVANLINTERSASIEFLRDLLSVRIPQSERSPADGVREGKMWFALEVAKRYKLSELHSDIEALIDDVRLGKTYLPYYADMISKYHRFL